MMRKVMLERIDVGPGFQPAAGFLAGVSLRQRRFVVAGLLLWVPFGSCSPKSVLPQSYQDARTGLAIHYPSGWKLDPMALAFAIVDFPLDRRPPQVLVPIDRGEIGISAPPHRVANIGEWMRSDRISEALGYHLTQSHVHTRHVGVLEITVARANPDVIPYGTLLIYLFEIEGRPIKASLIYRGRKKATYFEDIFRSMIEDLEMTLRGSSPEMRTSMKRKTGLGEIAIRKATI